MVLQELAELVEGRARVAAAAPHEAGVLQTPVALVEWWAAAAAVVAPRVGAARLERAEPAPPADATRT